MHAEKSLLREYLEALLIAVIFATFARTWVVQAFKIPSGSMEENLLIGDHILVNKFIYGPTVLPLEEMLLPVRKVQRGDVVVFKYPEDPSRDFIKRCVASAGDKVQTFDLVAVTIAEERNLLTGGIEKKEVKVPIDRMLYINGQEAQDSGYVVYKSLGSDPHVGGDQRLESTYGPYTVPPRSYFCMGDNRDNSNDSRYWGPVPESNLKGRAFMVYWSFDSNEIALGAPKWRDRLRQIGRVALNFFPQTRWDRTFRIVR